MENVVFREKRSNSIQIDTMNDIVNSFKTFIRINGIYYNNSLNLSSIDRKYSKISGYPGFYFKNLFSPDYNPILAIKDRNNNYRYLVLFNYHLKEHTYMIFGCIIYVNLQSDDDKCKDVKVIDKILFSYDLSFGTPSVANSFFTNQSLFVILNNYDKNVYEFHFVMFSYFDDFISTTNFTDSLFFGVDLSYNYRMIKGRFVEFFKDNCKSLIIDLMSLSNKNNTLNFSRYHVDSISELDINMAIDKPFSDGSKNTCNICGNYLCDIEIVNEQEITNLCSKCDLYHKNNRYYCSKFISGNLVCSNDITSCECLRNHIQDVEVRTKLIHENKRFPNRRKFQIEIINEKNM